MSPDGGAGCLPFLPPLLSTPIFIELTIISAQELFPSSRSIRTYAVTWLHPAHPLRTRLDSAGRTHPTWNDKFLFRVDDSTLRSETSAIQINIYASRPRFLPGHDSLLGTARAVLSTFLPSTSTRFVALQVRRPTSLRPQGILNIAIAFPNPSLCNLPLYTNPLISAIAYHDLMPSANQAKKTGLKDIHPTLPLHHPQSNSRPAIEKIGPMENFKEMENFVLEKKLKKWRSEIWTAEDQMGWENGEQSPASADEERGPRKGKPRRPRAMSCFNLVGHYEDEIENDEVSSKP